MAEKEVQARFFARLPPRRAPRARQQDQALTNPRMGIEQLTTTAAVAKTSPRTKRKTTTASLIFPMAREERGRGHRARSLLKVAAHCEKAE